MAQAQRWEEKPGTFCDVELDPSGMGIEQSLERNGRQGQCGRQDLNTMP